MTTPVKTRSYRSPRRQEQAAATRRSVLRAARDLFTRDGYAATTVTAIAAAAGVSLDTVYASVGRKPELLLAVIDQVLASSDEPVDLEEREYVKAHPPGRDGTREDRDLRRRGRSPRAPDRAAAGRPAARGRGRRGLCGGLGGDARTAGGQRPAAGPGPAHHRRAARRPHRPGGGRHRRIHQRGRVLPAAGPPRLDPRALRAAAGRPVEPDAAGARLPRVRPTAPPGLTTP